MKYPYPTELTRRYYDMILQNFDYISGKNINPTFLKTVEAVADHNQIPQDAIRAALQEMLDKGYVYQKEVPIAFNRKIKIVCANWEQLIKDGPLGPGCLTLSQPVVFCKTSRLFVERLLYHYPYTCDKITLWKQAGTKQRGNPHTAKRSS